MTLDEAKQLKHGDIVLVEMEVMKDSYDGTVCSCGHVLVRVPGMEKAAASLRPYQMREKIEPPRRKFRKGDIVLSGGVGVVNFVIEGETDKMEVKISAIESLDCGYRCEANRLTLICPVEERADRKGEP